MQNPPSTSLTFYPAYCLSLSPTYNTWARLTAADVHALQEQAGYDGQNIYFHLNHPIKWIRLVGVVVSLDCKYGHWFIQLDDSCGATIELICGYQAAVASTTDVRTDLSDKAFLKTRSDQRLQQGLTATGRTVNLAGVDVGAVIKVKGGVGVYRGVKQVMLERLSLVHSTDEEVAAWAETSAFRRDVLNVPWEVEERELRRAARKAEGRGRRPKGDPDQMVKKRKKLEKEPKHENDKDRGPNRDKGKQLDELTATARQKPERGKSISARIKERDVRIPPDQQRRLDREDSWLPADPDQSTDINATGQQEPESKARDLVNREDQSVPLFQTARRYNALGR